MREVKACARQGGERAGSGQGGAVPAWKFEHRPEGEGTCVLLGWEVSFLFSVQYNLVFGLSLWQK